MRLTSRSEAVTSLGGHADLWRYDHQGPTAAAVSCSTSEANAEVKVISSSAHGMLRCVAKTHSSDGFQASRRGGSSRRWPRGMREHRVRHRRTSSQGGHTYLAVASDADLSSAADRCGGDASRSGTRRRCSHHRVSRRLIGLLAIRPSTRKMGGLQEFPAISGEGGIRTLDGRNRPYRFARPAPLTHGPGLTRSRRSGLLAV